MFKNGFEIKWKVSQRFQLYLLITKVHDNNVELQRTNTILMNNDEIKS